MVSIDKKRGDELLKGGLLAAFTTAVAACGGGAAQAATFVNTSLSTPVSFDLINPGSPVNFVVGGETVTISGSGSAGSFNLSLDAGSNLTVTDSIFLGPAWGNVSSFSSPGAIGTAAGYDFPTTNTFQKTTSTGSLASLNSGVVNTDLGNGAGYVALFLGAGETPAYLSYSNVISTGPTDDVLTITGYGVAAVPEPETWALMVLGAAGVGGMLRRRRTLAAMAA